MSRAVEEWKGKTDDTPLPPRVKVRLFESAGGCCAHCGISIRPGNGPAYDHIKALINGGENREANFQVLCVPCHASKTAVDVAEKSTVYEKRAKHLGAKVKKPWNNGLRKRMNGTVVDAKGNVVSPK